MVYSPNFASLFKRAYVLIAVVIVAITVFVSVVYADSVPVVGFNNQPSQTSDTTVTIDVHVNDTESNDVTISVRYSLDDGGTWSAAQQLSGAAFPIVGNEVTEITTYGDGPNNRSNVGFFWNFLEEPGIESSDTVRIEVTPRDISGEGNAIMSSAFSIVVPGLPPVFADESGEVTDITQTSAVVNYSISDTGSAELTDFELRYASEEYYINNASYDENGPIIYSGSFSLTGATDINGLSCGTTYHFVQSFTNGDGESATSSDATFTTLTCDEDLKFYWPLDEGGGTETGVTSGYPGTLYGGVVWDLEGGVSLDGVDDYVRTDSTLADSMGVPDQAYTLSASVRVNDASETGNIIHISNNSSGVGWCIAMLHIEDGYFRAIGWDGNPVTAVNSVPAELGEWYSIANTWSPGSNTLDLYVNGSLVASTPMTNYQAADVPVYVFAGIDAPGCSENQGWFKGDVKDVRIYSRAITQEEAEDNANASLGTISATLSPEDDDDGVSITSDLEMTFSTTTVATSSGTIGLYRTADNSLVEEFQIDSDRISIFEDIVEIDPSSDFDWGTGYYVHIPDTAFVDTLGNTYPGTVSSSTWNFSTIDEPEEVDLGESNDIDDESIFEMLEQYFTEIEDMMWTSVSASSDGSHLVAVGTGFPEGGEGTATYIYTSDNGGADWELSTSTTTTIITSVTSSADGNSIIGIGVTATEVMNELDFIVMKSTDQGVSWDTQVIQTTDMEEFEDEFMLFISFYLSRITASSDLSKIYIALFNNIYYSDNGGSDWEIILPLEFTIDNSVFPLSISTSANGSKVMLAISPIMYGNSEMTLVLYSEDYGQTWNPVMTGEDVSIPFSVSVSEDGERLFVVDPATSYMYVSIDDGETWSTSENPDGNSWMYVAPAATGAGIVASALEDVSDEYGNDAFWQKTVLYSSLDNGTSWTRHTESEAFVFNDGLEGMIGQLVGNISGSYNLSNLGLVNISKLFVITQDEPTLPEVTGGGSPSSGGYRREKGCKDETALNYKRGISHRQSLCVYEDNEDETALAPTSTSTPTLPVRDLAYLMTGDDVLLLQKLLNKNGYMLASAGPGSFGNETTFFGSLTRGALTKFQADNNVAPAVGYFGPITRGRIDELGLKEVWW